jgi:hypothetical protein
MSMVQCTFNMTAELPETGPTDEEDSMVLIGEILSDSTSRSEGLLAARNEIAGIVSNNTCHRPSLTRKMLKLGNWHGAAFRGLSGPQLAEEHTLGSRGVTLPNAPLSGAFCTQVDHKLPPRILPPRTKNRTRKHHCCSAASGNGNLTAVACVLQRVHPPPAVLVQMNHRADILCPW